jgi:uncharacterized membrane protein YwzB
VGGILVLTLLCFAGVLAPRTVGYFLLGMAMRGVSNEMPSSCAVGVLCVSVIALFGWGEVANFGLAQIAWCLGILTFLGGLGKACAATRGVIFLAWLGRNSLIIVVLHALFVVALKPLGRIIILIEPTGVAYLVVVVLTTIVGCLFGAFALDHLKLSSALFGVGKIYSNYSTIRNKT